MENSRSSRTFSYYLSLCIGRAGRRRLTKLVASIKAHTGQFSLSECLRPESMAMVLPEDRGEALLQMHNVVSIAASMPRTRLTLVGRSDVVPYFANLQGISSVLDYHPRGRFLFSRELSSIWRSLAHDGHRVCLMLEREPDLSLLYLAARSGAKLRIGYEGAGEYPYLNMHVRGAGGRTYLADRNLLMAETLGAQPVTEVRWTVPKETATEMQHLLRECGIKPDSSPLIGVDASYFFGRAGGKWLDELVSNLRTRIGLVPYLYVDGAPSDALREWLRRAGLPVLVDLTPSRTVALLSRTAVILSGTSPLFHLARFVGTRAVGVFKDHEVGTYCPVSADCAAVTFIATPDQDTIAGACRSASSLLSDSATRTSSRRK